MVRRRLEINLRKIIDTIVQKDDPKMKDVSFEDRFVIFCGRYT